MKNFIQRAITGLIFVAVLIGCMIGGPISFGVLFCIISALATAEFCNLMNQQEGVKFAYHQIDYNNKVWNENTGLCPIPLLLLLWHESGTNRHLHSIPYYYYLFDDKRTLLEERTSVE